LRQLDDPHPPSTFNIQQSTVHNQQSTIKELPMPSAISKTSRSNSRRRTIGVTKPQPTAAIKVTGVAKSGTLLTITFDQPVSLNGVPQYTTSVVGATAVSAIMTGMNTVAITFSATIATATSVTIPYEEPAVRNSSGGFVSTSTFPVA
jgi:hypothetical protein